MLPRFYAPRLDADLIRLDGDEAHHLANVLRLAAGDEVALFDGRGAERRGRVEAVGRRDVQVRVLDAVEPTAEPRVAITLAQAALKGDRMDAVVRDATMLGVVAVQPLVTRRTVVPAPAVTSERLRGRWHRIAIASAKQCRRAVVPEIRPAARFDEWVASTPGAYLLVEPVAHGEATVRVYTTTIGELLERPAPEAATVVVGPEGGWDEAELRVAARAGCVQLTLGARTMRADAAPLVVLAVLRTVWRDF
ncbi:MAG TPA: 16S rRNA (uracil(1498)-N(3))-methyltransferase [Vicinamibacterales bacterium]|jgi:16S rRNA (uracil1498-N3)-methyltransferase|nr:16S rRNA (uracil(1498)-N(3))-methyltransferase [Vicinamibacterales bacterium]